MDNIIAVLERRDRVCHISILEIESLELELLSAAMQQPFPELTYLALHFHPYSTTAPVIPDSFLGRSAPRLELLMLDRIPFPGLPNLLLSATHLVDLTLYKIPHSGYFSPEAMVTALSTLTGLSSFFLGFQSPRSCPDQESRSPPPSTRSVLSALTRFIFEGVSEYLDDLVVHIDTPRLDKLEITFFNDIVFDTPQFMQFISRTPMSRALEKAYIIHHDYSVSLGSSPPIPGDEKVKVGILCQGLDWQVSSMEQVCTSCLPPLSMLEDLYIHEGPDAQRDWNDDIENGLWLQLLHPFINVKNLYLSEYFALRIGPALKELPEGRTADMLPALQNIFLGGLQPSGAVQEDFEQFVASRQVTDRPIAISLWD